MAGAPVELELSVEPVTSLDDARGEWEALAERSRNPFLTWEWADAWWSAYGDDRRLAVHRARDAEGHVVAILPLYRADRAGMPLLRFVGHGPADELGPVCAPADRDRALRAVVETARATLPRRGVLLAERLPAGAAASAGIRARAVRHEPSPALPVADRSWEEWLASKSSHFRAQVRRLERKLAREHELEFRMADATTFDTDFDAFLRLHEARWRGEGSVAFAGARGTLHRDFGRRALDRGRLRLMFAVVDGEYAAGSYGLRFGGSDWCYQVGRDPRWDHYRVGFVLLAKTIRDAFDDRMTDFRFGLGGEDYKDRFAEADAGLESVVAGTPAVTRVLSAAVDGARRLPQGLRRNVGRRVA